MTTARAATEGARRAKPNAIPLRIRWAVDLIAPRSGERILEIGCGGGHAIKLICGESKAASIIAIDRSTTAIARATALNADAIKDGRAAFHLVDLADAKFPNASFAAIFAINVNLFWTGGAEEIANVARMLAPKGRLVLIYEPPAAAQIPSIAEKAGAALTRGGFNAVRVTTSGEEEASLLALTATRATASRPPGA